MEQKGKVNRHKNRPKKSYMRRMDQSGYRKMTLLYNYIFKVKLNRLAAFLPDI